MLLRLIQYKSYDSYSRSELQGQLGRPFAVHCLYYSTKSFLCQVNTVLNCFVYFMQHFITIFVQHLVAIFFARFAPYIIIIGRNSLQKYILDVQNLCLIRHSAVIFFAHFYTQSINLSNYIITYILLSVKLRLRKIFLYTFYKISQ